MKTSLRMLALAGLMLGASSAWAAPFIGSWPVADPTEVLVLGSPHLSGIDALKPEWTRPLLDRLVAFAPQIITIEALSGPECDQLRRYAKSWPGTADDYCQGVEKIAKLGEKATGLDRPAAEAASEEAAAALRPDSPPAAHRHAAALFAAAGNLGSAAVQWLRLPTNERRAGDGVDAPLATALDATAVRRNENFWVAAALAARLGLERVYPVDDHLSDRVQANGPPNAEKVMQGVWSAEPLPLVREAEAMKAALKDGPSLLAYYRMLNREVVAEAFVRVDMGRAFVEPSSERVGRRYVAWWEARNLYMVGNIRAALASRPGARALVVVGSTHKLYFERYLSMMHEVRLVPTARFLRR